MSGASAGKIQRLEWLDVWGLTWSHLQRFVAAVSGDVSWNSGLSMWLLVRPYCMVAGFQEHAFLREAEFDPASEAITLSLSLWPWACLDSREGNVEPRILWEEGITSWEEHVSDFVAVIFEKQNLSQSLAWYGSSFKIWPSLPDFFKLKYSPCTILCFRYTAKWFSYFSDYILL